MPHPNQVQPRRAAREAPVEGFVSLKWHVQRDGKPLLGCLLCVTFHGVTDTCVTTVTNALIHSDANGLVVADMRMFAREDGRPLWDGRAVVARSGVWQRFRRRPKTGTFRFYVTSIGTCVHEGPVRVGDGKCDLEVARGA